MKKQKFISPLGFKD